MSDHVCGSADQKQSVFTGPINVNEPERLASATLGGFLIAMGLGRTSPLQKVAAMVAGGGLIYRGLSGNCMMYRLLGMLRNDEGKRVEAQIDEAGEDSFPASDPPAFTASAASPARHSA